MSAHSRRALFEARNAADPRMQAIARRHAAEQATRRADINEPCDACGFDNSAHLPLSRIATRNTFLRCPEGLPGFES